MTQPEARALVVALAGEWADINELLEATAGTKEGQTEKVYRPRFVAAYLIGSKREIIEAEGVKWSGEGRITTLLNLQRVLDAGLTIPDGFEADPCNILPCNDASTASIPAMAWSGSVETIRTF